ncbi:MAG: hypothetical protein KJ060_00590 [Candidatus Hydrogenedentes bacterium]|nr:hypothetical protein [Candidatus Hydrogenedentota bacterium]
MRGNVGYLLVGLVLGVVLTVVAALLVGPNVNVTSSANVNNAGRYELVANTTEKGTEFALLDSETGETRVLRADGNWLTLTPSSSDNPETP